MLCSPPSWPSHTIAHCLWVRLITLPNTNKHTGSRQIYIIPIPPPAPAQNERERDHHGAKKKTAATQQQEHHPRPPPKGFLPWSTPNGLLLSPTDVACRHRGRREAAGWKCLGPGGEGLRGAGHGPTRGDEVRGSSGGVRRWNKEGGCLVARRLYRL